MRNKKAYESYKFLKSVDFSDYDDGLVQIDDVGRRISADPLTHPTVNKSVNKSHVEVTSHSSDYRLMSD